ncbi:MAG: hypothetical protein ACQETZ_08280 [Candidatus Fermentibacterota bacterium]
MVAARWMAPALCALLLAAGCHEVTEYTDSGEFGAVILRTSDLSVVGYVAGMDGARSLVSMGGSRFLVGTSTGRVYEVDSEVLEIVRHQQVTAGSGAGIRRMVKSPSASTIYLLTGSGKILEMDSETFGIVDDFTAGASPSDICRSPGSIPRIYVSDMEQGRIREVWTSDNHVGKVIEVPEMPVSLAGYLSAPDVLVSAHEGQGGVNIVDIEAGGSISLLSGSSGPFSDVAVAGADTIVCAGAPRWDADNGRLLMVKMGEMGPSVSSFPVEGHPTSVSASPPGSSPLFYAACADGDRTVVVALNYLHGQVQMTAELEGYPWAVSTHRNGEYLIVLTSI